MKLIPALDFLSGKIVRLRQGNFDETTFFDLDLSALAQELARASITELHCVDLSGARDPEESQSLILLKTLQVLKMRIQLGGGIRNEVSLHHTLALGTDRIVVGTWAWEDPDHFLKALKNLTPKQKSQITLGFDVHFNEEENSLKVATHGWTETLELNWKGLLKKYQDSGITRILCTEISRDGMLSGPALGLYKYLSEQLPGFEIQASGGGARSGRLRGFGGAQSSLRSFRPKLARVLGASSKITGVAMLKPRIIACLDIQGDRLVKGVKFEALEDLGSPLEKALAYQEQGIDEIVVYEISAAIEGRRIANTRVEEISKNLSIPLCVAGGIRSLKDAECILALGVDKVSINSAALARPELVDELAQEFGSQCVVVGIDCAWGDSGKSEVFLHGGSGKNRKSSKKNTLDWVKEVSERGAGEIVVNSIDRDGTREGFDLALMQRVREKTKLPLIASGGASQPQDFQLIFQQAQVDGALLAGALHRGEITVSQIKNHLREVGISVRW